MKRVCVICNLDFDTNHNNKITCSSVCSDENKKKYDREYGKKYPERIKINAKKYRQTEKCKKYHRAYGQTEKGKAIKKRYNQSERGKAMHRKSYKKYIEKIKKQNPPKERVRVYDKENNGKEYMRKYHQSEKYKEYQRRYKRSEKYKEYQRRYRQSEKRKISQTKYIQSEKCQTTQLKYRQSEKWKISYLSRSHKRRSHFKHAGELDMHAWFKKLKLLNFQCVYCGSKDKIQIDHIWPLSKGGTNHIDNLQPLCRFCNYSKHDKILIKPMIQKISN